VPDNFTGNTLRMGGHPGRSYCASPVGTSARLEVRQPGSTGRDEGLSLAT